MVKLKINGIQVEMPYEPYQPQIVTMSKLIECFQTNTNSLIESPTGTGKSLSIICSVLSYYEQERKKFSSEIKPFKIFICSRTHKQIDQLIEQLRKTSYKPRITVLGSKNQYCINSKLSKVEDKNTACSDLLKVKGCSYFSGKDRLIKKIGDKIFDIEELKEEGKRCNGCPYFASRGLQEEADVIFAPYNYLIDANVRESSEIKLENAILIIDEAHNIEDCCRAAGSIEISSKLIEIVINELVGAIKRSALLGEIKGEFINLLDLFRKLKEHSKNGSDFEKKIRKGKEIIKELEEIGIGKEVFLVYKNGLQSILKDEEAKSLLSLNTARFMQEIERVLGMVLFTGSEAYSYCFMRHLEGNNNNKNGNNNNKNGNSYGNNNYNNRNTSNNIINTNRSAAVIEGDYKYSYSFWLLDPSIMFLPLVSNIKSISLLSGTLTPFSSFCSELKFQFQHKITAPHIMRTEQVFISIIKKGHLNKELCGTYNITETPAYLEQVSKIILDISSQVRTVGGTLVFVPSYSFLYKLAGRIPEAILEPKEGGMAEFERIIELYKQKIQKKLPSIFICVYRGKASEGIDFRDEFSRAVIAIGIPYPSIKDPQIELKKEYNDKNGGYNGRMWYESQAYRAVNQALGRAIRHTNDWGSIFLIDSRYSEKRYQNGLPSWVLMNLKIHENFGESLNELKGFISCCSNKGNSKDSSKENKVNK